MDKAAELLDVLEPEDIEDNLFGGANEACSTSHVIDHAQVVFKRQFENIIVVFQKFCHAPGRSIVDQQIDPTNMRHGFVDGVISRIAHTHVSLDPDSIDVRLVKLTDDQFAFFGRLAVDGKQALSLFAESADIGTMNRRICG